MHDRENIEIYLQEIREKFKDSVDDLFNALEILHEKIKNIEKN
jgi:hypothetical protein